MLVKYTYSLIFHIILILLCTPWPHVWIAIIRQVVGILVKVFLLKRLYWSHEINFTLEKFTLTNFILRIFARGLELDLLYVFIIVDIDILPIPHHIIVSSILELLVFIHILSPISTVYRPFVPSQIRSLNWLVFIFIVIRNVTLWNFLLTLITQHWQILLCLLKISSFNSSMIVRC